MGAGDLQPGEVQRIPMRAHLFLVTHTVLWLTLPTAGFCSDPDHRILLTDELAVSEQDRFF